MPDRLRFHPSVVDDLRQAISWYEKISPALADRFRSEVNERFDEVADRRQFFAWAFTGVRFAKVRKFPYLVLFQEQTEVVIVLGVFHSASDPEKWRRRITSKT
jgi:hypothetical protein